MSIPLKQQNALIDDNHQSDDMYDDDDEMYNSEEFEKIVDRATKDNPDLPREFVRDILIARQEIEDGKATPYEFECS